MPGLILFGVLILLTMIVGSIAGLAASARVKRLRDEITRIDGFLTVLKDQVRHLRKVSAAEERMLEGTPEQERAAIA